MLKTMKAFLVTLAVLLGALSTSAFAEGSYQDEDELRLVRAISVYIQDQVKDGCLSNPNALKVEAEVTLRRAGISVVDSDLHYQLGIVPVGWGTKSTSGQYLESCSVKMRLQLWRFAKVPEGHTALVTAYRTEFLLTGFTKPRMKENLRTVVSEYVSDIANEILKARGK